MLDAGADLRDVQIAAWYADPRTTMRYDRARNNLDRHRTTSWPPTWHLARDPACASRGLYPREASDIAELRALCDCIFTLQMAWILIG